MTTATQHSAPSVSRPGADSNNVLNALRPDSAVSDDQQASLDQLRDLQLPDPIGFWPPAPGWWLLALILIALMLWSGWRLLSRMRRNRYRHYALAELQRLDQSEPQRWLQQLNQLLRRTALVAYPHQPIAALSGQAWLDFLYHSSRLDGFQQPLGRTLAEGPYRSHADIDTAGLTDLAQQWIKRHRHTLPPTPSAESQPC